MRGTESISATGSGGLVGTPVVAAAGGGVLVEVAVGGMGVGVNVAVGGTGVWVGGPWSALAVVA
jgi:hypothetical protein